MEEWRNVPGFNGKYQIDISTKEGRCRSTNYRRTGKIKVLANTVNKGYICWNLTLDGKQKSRTAAYWIAITYPELVQNEYFEGAEIDHIIPLSVGGTNYPSNLRWVTHKDNINNPLSKIHRSSALRNNQKLSKPIVQYSLQGEYIATHLSVHEANRVTEVDRHNIINCCEGKVPYAGTRKGDKYVWKYKG